MKKQSTHERSEIVKQVLALTDYTKGMYGDRHPAQGQMVVTGQQVGGSTEGRIGYCVQIRKNCGQFGSDMVFLRRPDGGLTTHENQGYYPMTDEQEKLARSLFAELPEDEDYSEGYLCCGKVHELGFLIDHSKSTPTPNTPFNLTVSDGTSKTLITHIG
jgi:hypothetical protein